ncbi:hypothetical protein ACSBR1_026096 [Camellia fascicularis]
MEETDSSGASFGFKPMAYPLTSLPSNMGNDIWISYKFEKLSEFCYAYGRLGHDSNGCKFVSKEAGDQSGYGLDLRTGTTRLTFLPVEHYRRQVDEAEHRLQGLLRRLPPPFVLYPTIPPARDPNLAMVPNQSDMGSHIPLARSDKGTLLHPSAPSATTGSYDHSTPQLDNMG